MRPAPFARKSRRMHFCLHSEVRVLSVVNLLVRRPHNNEYANQESMRRLMLTSSNVCVNQTDAERV